MRAGTVEAPGDYRWSSYRSNGLYRPAGCWTPHPHLYLALRKTPAERATEYRKLFRGQIDKEMLAEVRRSANQGMALGNERFKAEVESVFGQKSRSKQARSEIKQAG